MARALDLRALGQIVAVRRVQVAVAETRFWEACRLLGALETKQEACRMLIARMQSGWLAAVSSGSVQLATAQAFGARMETLFGELSDIDHEIAAAEKRRAQLAAELGLCNARQAAAEGLEKTSIRRAARRSEEAWSNEASERHAARMFMS